MKNILSSESRSQACLGYAESRKISVQHEQMKNEESGVIINNSYRIMEIDKISRDFSWEEMIASETAEIYGIDNRPGRKERQAIQELVKRVLQPLRIAYGRPIRISSGYRSPELNKRVGGVPSSQHVKGEAADCVVINAMELLGVLLAHKIPFDQAILYRKRNFLHLSNRVSGKNRRRIIVND